MPLNFCYFGTFLCPGDSKTKTHKTNEITEGLMVERIGNLITSYHKQKKKPAALLDRLS